MGCHYFSFTLQGLVSFEGSERGMLISVVGWRRGFGFEGMEGGFYSKGSTLSGP